MPDARLNGLNPLAYIGVNPYTPPDFVTHPRAPTTNDWQNFELGTFWLNNNAASATYKNVWVLVSLTGNQAIWALISSGGGDLTSLKADDGLTALPDAAGQILIHSPDANITTTAATANTITATLAQDLNVRNVTVSGNAAGTSAQFIVDYTGNDTFSGSLGFNKNRNNGILQSGDSLGKVAFSGLAQVSPGNSPVGALIEAVSTGTIAFNRVPGILNFYTHPDSVVGSPTLRMVINQAGNIIISAPTSGDGLTVSGTILGTTLYATGDAGGVAASNALSNVSSSTIGAGVGSIAMSSANPATNTAWIKIYIGTNAFWIPAWTTNAP